MKFINQRLKSFLSALLILGVLYSSVIAVSAADGSLSLLQPWNMVAVAEDDIKLEASQISVNGVTVAQLPISLNKNDTVSLSADIKTSGEYLLAFKYGASSSDEAAISLVITIGENTFRGILPIIWSDVTKDYETDRNGDEVIPEQKLAEGSFFDVVCDERSINQSELKLTLSEGVFNAQIEILSNGFSINEVYLVSEKQPISYKDYSEKNGKQSDIKELITIEGEDYISKSESYIRGKSTKNPHLNPYKSGKKSVCVIDGSTWNSPGQTVMYEFEVAKDGLYELAFHYSQYTDANQNIYREIKIDGETPFKEFENVSFPATESGEYKNYTLADNNGKPYKIHLTKGTHTISFKAIMGKFEAVYNDLLKVMNTINTIGMDLKKLSAGSTDSNRTWDMDVVMPGAVKQLSELVDDINKIYDSLEAITGEKPVYADSLVYAANSLEKLIENPRVLPNKTELLNVGDNSVSKFLGTVLSKMNVAPLTIDQIYFNSNDKLPKNKASVFKVFFESVGEFIRTFTTEYSSIDADISNKGSELSVWVNRSVQYTEVLQQLLDRTYNKDNKTAIRLSIMPSEQKLILANASGTNPDLVLSVACTTPFDFAIRNAAVDISQFEDFGEFYKDNFNIEALTPLSYDNGVYGLPETLDFNVLFYRKDILDVLGLEVPQTWDDVRYMMPTLLRYNMNFYIPLSASAGYKSFSLTSPFFFQNGVQIYTEDGNSVDFASDAFVAAANEMIDLYTVFGMQQAVPSFYNSFRYSEIPIGIGNSGIYLQLISAAPELSGLWDIALAPGTEDDGEIVRYQPADVTASMIFKNTTNKDKAWSLLKWWMSADTQSEYANALRSKYGPEYFWCSANLEAFSKCYLPDEHKKVILEQWNWQKEMPRHPANYMVERSVSNIWSNVVVNGDELSDSIDRAEIDANREILRKLEEFGYYTSGGKMVKSYKVNSLDEIKEKIN